MAPRRRFELDILCPNCGASGGAWVSENDGAAMPDPAFTVDEYPDGFSEQKHSNRRQQTLIQCRCGQAFYLL